MCGGGDLFAREQKQEVVVRTGAGLKTCRLIGRQDGREEGTASCTFEFETDMGRAGGRRPIVD